LERQRADLQAEIRRCTEIGQQQVTLHASRAAAALAALKDLHARRFAGERVADAEIVSGEQAYRSAKADAERAEPAAAGAKVAEQAFIAKVSQVLADLRALDDEAMPLLRQILTDRAVRSMAQHRVDAEHFARTVQAHHHAEIAAIDHVAKLYGLGSLNVYTDPNQGGRVLDVPITPTPDKYLDVLMCIDLGKDIDAEAMRIAAEIQEMLP
jgi:hypothetical protein